MFPLINHRSAIGSKYANFGFFESPLFKTDANIVDAYGIVCCIAVQQLISNNLASNSTSDLKTVFIAQSCAYTNNPQFGFQ